MTPTIAALALALGAAPAVTVDGPPNGDQHTDWTSQLTYRELAR